MNIGDVLYFHDFSFQDGGHANKILIVLSDPAKGSVVLVIVTSKGKNTNALGCQPTPKKFFIRAGQNGFYKDTWVDLYREPYIYEVLKIEECLKSGKVERISTLPQQIVNAIKNCMAKNSMDSLSRYACDLLDIKLKR